MWSGSFLTSGAQAGRVAEYRVLRAPEWREAGDHVELWDPGRARWVPLKASMGRVLRGVAEGRPVAQLVRPRDDAREQAKAESRIRRFVYNLSRLGYVEIPLASPPPVFAARYEVVKELGRGGVGVAYLCRDRDEGGAEVVVKRAWDFLQPYRVTEAAMRREAVVMARLDHPGVARSYASFELEGHLHLVREFLRGADLASLAGAGIPDVARRRAVQRGIADVLAHLHERGYVMLDLRPSNFILDEATGAPRLLDVGQCREHGGGEIRFPRRVGSPGFMSPEMTSRRVATVRSDVWGFGRLSFFLATGTLPSPDADAAWLAARAPAEERALLGALAADDPSARPPDMRSAKALVDAAPLGPKI